MPSSPSQAVVFAPDSFKGSISASAAASALASGWVSVRPDDGVILRPMADGGEGTLDAFEAAVPGARRVAVAVEGPDRVQVGASWLLLPPTDNEPEGVGVVELASTSGIELLGERRLPWDASTVGFGQAIAAALDHGVSRLILGIGSSASTDGGTGMLSALGADLRDSTGRPIRPGARGLSRLGRASLEGLRRLPPGGAVVLTDVTNPLLGPSGAAAVFGPQKGLEPREVPIAEAGLARLAELLPADPAGTGAGAAGGAGFALIAWGARLVPGASHVAQLVHLREARSEAAVVVTGEGSFDGQSAAGKAPSHVAELAASLGVQVGLAAGRISRDAGASRFFATASLTDLAGSRDAAMAEPARWLTAAGAALALSAERMSDPR